MNCKKAETYLVEYLYQELSAKKTVAIEKHLQACDHCTKTIESWRAIHRGYQRTLEELQPSPYLKQRLLVMAKEQLSQPPSLAERLFLGLKIAAVPILIFGILMIFHLQQKETQIAQVQKEAAPAPPVQMQDKPAPSTRSMEPARRRDTSSTEYNAEARIGKDELSEGGRKQESTKSLSYLAEEKKKAYSSGYYADQEGKKADLLLKEQAQVGDSSAAPAAPVEAPEMEASKPMSQDAAKIATNEPQASAAPGELLRQSMDDYRMNKITDAVKRQKQAIDQDPSGTLAPQLHQTGVEFQNSREYGKAIAQFNLVLSNYRGYSGTEDVLLRLAQSYEAVGQFGNAISVYRQLLKSSGQQRLAQQKIDELSKKQEAQQQLRELGYIKE